MSRARCYCRGVPEGAPGHVCGRRAAKLYLPADPGKLRLCAVCEEDRRVVLLAGQRVCYACLLLAQSLLALEAP